MRGRPRRRPGRRHRTAATSLGSLSTVQVVRRASHRPFRGRFCWSGPKLGRKRTRLRTPRLREAGRRQLPRPARRQPKQGKAGRQQGANEPVRQQMVHDVDARQRNGDECRVIHKREVPAVLPKRHASSAESAKEAAAVVILSRLEASPASWGRARRVNSPTSNPRHRAGQPDPGNKQRRCGASGGGVEHGSSWDAAGRGRARCIRTPHFDPVTRHRLFLVVVVRVLLDDACPLGNPVAG